MLLAARVASNSVRDLISREQGEQKRQQDTECPSVTSLALTDGYEYIQHARGGGDSTPSSEP